MNLQTAVLALITPFLVAVMPVTFAADTAGLIADCEACHGKNGASTDPMVPTIAGYSAYYLAESLLIYKEKARPCPQIKYLTGAKKGTSTTMCEAVAHLSEEQSNAIGEYYAEKPFVRAKQAFDPALAKIGSGLHELHCTKCHEDGGSSPDDDAGILAGQWTPFLDVQMTEYLEGKRPMDEKMKPKMEVLKPEDVKALLHFYASFQ